MLRKSNLLKTHMIKKFTWTNPSVLRFAEGHDPIERIERAARELALQAMDEGWSGPPFDPLALAERCGLRLDARGDIPDARLVQGLDVLAWQGGSISVPHTPISVPFCTAFGGSDAPSPIGRSRC